MWVQHLSYFAYKNLFVTSPFQVWGPLGLASMQLPVFSWIGVLFISLASTPDYRRANPGNEGPSAMLVIPQGTLGRFIRYIRSKCRLVAPFLRLKTTPEDQTKYFDTSQYLTSLQMIRHQNIWTFWGWYLACAVFSWRWIDLAETGLVMADYTLYYIHFEITGYPCNLIRSQQCDLFLNRTIFCSKSHLFQIASFMF